LVPAVAAVVVAVAVVVVAAAVVVSVVAPLVMTARWLLLTLSLSLDAGRNDDTRVVRTTWVGNDRGSRRRQGRMGSDSNKIHKEGGHENNVDQLD
jgi:hypothetical protein